ncbi:hypothetical protein [Methylobacterium platani]|uniref:hypothetical protein n=1 Tax=Methylobacterium platani TaxID=427683 RepID=UPI000A7FE035|nr:hypothetical protein [Methylobacterium platani]
MSFSQLDRKAKHEIEIMVKKVLEIEDGLGAFYKRDFLVHKRWSVALFEGDFRDKDDSIAQGLAKKGISRIFCGGLADYMTDWYQINPEDGDLKDVRNKYFEPSYFITDKFNEFCIVSDSDYYWALASRRDNIANIFNVDLEKSLLRMRENVAPLLRDSADSDYKTGKMLQKYLKICESVN